MKEGGFAIIDFIQIDYQSVKFNRMIGYFIETAPSFVSAESILSPLPIICVFLL